MAEKPLINWSTFANAAIISTTVIMIANAAIVSTTVIMIANAAIIVVAIFTVKIWYANQKTL